MNIESEKEKIIFRHEINGKVLYSIGLSHKKQDGTWENGYMPCRFHKDTDIKDKTKIKILNAWLDFYIKDKVTTTYIFINKYELVEDVEKAIAPNIKSEYDDIKSDIQLTDEDIDKTFNNDSLELPF